MSNADSLFNSSPYNSEPAVRNYERIRTPLHLVDVTLREGQQAPGVAFSASSEIEVGRALARAGVSILQAGFAARDEASVARLRQALPETTLAVLAVSWSPDLTAQVLRNCVDAGASICYILMRSSPGHLENLSLSEDDAVRKVAEATGRAREAGFTRVIIAPSFTTLTPFDLFERMFDAGLAEGGTDVGITDTTGIAKPNAIRAMVTRVREHVGDDVGVVVHAHNDFGLALANSLAAIEAGADWIDVSVLGLGERAGNCALEELVVALHGLYNIDTGVDLTQLAELCSVVASHAGLTIPLMKPVVGSNVFTNKLELHVRAIASDPTLVEPYDPTVVGNRRRLQLGKGSGPTGVTLKAAELGLSLTDEDIDALVLTINEIAIVEGHELSDEEFAELIRTRTDGTTA